jgi:hypothetical protein
VFAADQGYLAHKLLLDEVTLLVDRNDPAAGMRVERSKTGSVHLFVPRLAAQPEAMGELWREKERYKTLTGGAVRIECEEIELVPFLEAGTTDARNYREGIQPNSEPVTHISFQVWLPYQVRG